jgi:hypothetical protein
MKRAGILLLLVAAWPMCAQFDTATVLGTVRDTSGAVVAGAKVTLSNVETGIKAQASTDSNGNYEFLNVRIGRYTVVAEMSGFSTATAENFTVTVGARQRVDLELKVGTVTEVVQVTDAVKLLETDSSDRGQVISRQQIVELPLNGRNYADLALLTTGVKRSAYAFANPPREGAFNANGQRSTFNNFLLDGVDNNAYGTSNQGFSNQVVQLSPDAVAEFKVVTNNMSAEYGRTSGAVVNASMRSGTNAFHGTAWEFVRNTSLNAVGFFKPRGGKPVLQRNQFGFTLGGPVKRDRAFFFTHYEGFRERFKFLTFSSIPTVADRQGIFNREVRNPLTGRSYPANTQIPAADITPFARKVLAELPAPNGAGRTDNWQNLRSDKNNNDKMDVKLDGQFNSRWSAFVRLSHRKSNLLQQPEIPGPSGGGGNGFIRVLNQYLATGFTYLPSSASLFEFRLGLSRTRAGKETVALGGPNMQELYGITGQPTDKRIVGGLSNQTITGFTALGVQATNPQWQHPFLYNPRANYSIVKGRHSLKTGYEWQRLHTEIQDVNPLYGLDTYAGQFSRAAGVATGTGADQQTYNLVDFMFGLRSSYALTNFFVAQYRQVLHALYFQDDFKVNSKLTLNLGLRYEYGSPQWEANNKLTNFDPAANRLVAAKDGSIADRALIDPDRNNFAPRLGFAWSPIKKTVVRGGYGISYVHFNRSGGGNILAINGPQVVNAVVAQQPGQAGYRTTQDGYPAGLTDPDKFVAVTSNISYYPRESRTGYVQSWFVNVQRELLKNTVLDIGYVGNHGLKLIMFADYNQARPNGPAENAALQARRPNQAFGPITVTFPAGFSNYHALQLKLEKRYSAGLYLLNSFTWSKAIDNVGQALEDQGNGNRSSPQNFYNLRSEKGLSAYHQKFNNTTSAVWQVPVGKGRKYLASMHPVGEYLIGGWQISAINNLWSGEPLNFLYSPAALFQVSNIGPDWRGSTNTSARPNIVGNPVLPSDQRTPTRWFNEAAVAVPTDRSQPFGNAGRNAVIGPGLFQFDLGVQKDFALPLREGMSLQFRSEFFNLTNRTNFRAPATNRSAATFGRIASAYPARQVQFGLKLIF